jgi:16S rRNA (guanine(966)-N(2))-methyltransferase RsmD
MRIISGKWKGRPIKVPPGLPIRPTTDIAKEALFNILENRLNLDSSCCLDLFAGSGNISYELISRGSPAVLAIDRNALCCRFINSIRQEMGMEGLKVVHSDVFKYVTGIREKFDLIFADPPYDLPNTGNLIKTIMNMDILNPGGFLVLEHPSLISQAHHPGYRETRVYGSSSFSFFT